MAHIPHLLLPDPWGDDGIELHAAQRDHLAKVLRRSRGSTVSYTDGAGRRGEGTWEGDVVARGTEITVARPSPALCLAVAPPRSRDRARFLVEKLAELGVDELCWLETRFGQADPPGDEKARAWSVGALEQSRGSWLMEVSGPSSLDELDGVLVVADLTGSDAVPLGASRYTVLVGPEGGFDESEIPDHSARVKLSDRVLRTETAAIVSAAVMLKGLDR